MCTQSYSPHQPSEKALPLFLYEAILYLERVLLELRISAPIFPMVSLFLSPPAILPQYMKSSLLLLKNKTKQNNEVKL